jgi:hypothetical protein
MLLNMAYVYHVQNIKNLDIEIIGRNLLDQEIDLPEIARDNNAVETIPSNYETSLHVGLKYSF